ncbi:MAG: hypothetical protein Q9214_003410 [Letrouitia sp. 1 TL-2023]
MGQDPKPPRSLGVGNTRLGSVEVPVKPYTSRPQEINILTYQPPYSSKNGWTKGGIRGIGIKGIRIMGLTDSSTRNLLKAARLK